MNNQLPNSLDAEQAVIGSCLKNPDVTETVYPAIKDIEFYQPKHQKIYSAMKKVYNRSEITDITTVSNQLLKEKLLESVGGRVYLVKLVEEITSMAGLKSHVNIVKDMYLRRQLIITLEGIIETCYKDKPAGEIVDYAESKIFQLSQGRVIGEFIPIQDVFNDATERIQLFQTGEIVKDLITTPWEAVNDGLVGYEPGTLNIVGGSVSHGKSQYALEVAEYNAYNRKIPVGFYSLEMLATALATRVISSRTEISSHNMKRKDRLTPQDWTNINSFLNKWSDSPLYVNDNTNLSMDEFISQARRGVSQKGFKLIVVDYLQLMTGGVGDNREQQLSYIARMLKMLATELRIPIVALSQLNDVPPNIVPTGRNIRESKAIFAHSDTTIFTWHKQDVEAGKPSSFIILDKVRTDKRGDHIPMTFLDGRWRSYMREMP